MYSRLGVLGNTQNEVVERVPIFARWLGKKFNGRSGEGPQETFQFPTIIAHIDVGEPAALEPFEEAIDRRLQCHGRFLRETKVGIHDGIQ